MDISFSSNRLQKKLGDTTALIRQFGLPSTKKIQRALRAMERAENLHSIGHLHPKPLKADMKGQFHIVVGGGLRLYFEPDHSPLPTVNDGGLDRKKVTAIKILEVDDKH